MSLLARTIPAHRHGFSFRRHGLRTPALRSDTNSLGASRKRHRQDPPPAHPPLPSVQRW